MKKLAHDPVFMLGINEISPSPENVHRHEACITARPRGKGRASGKKLLAEKLAELTGSPVRRESVNEWLHPDPEKRRQPPLGMGLLVFEVWKQVFSPPGANEKSQT